MSFKVVCSWSSKREFSATLNEVYYAYVPKSQIGFVRKMHKQPFIFDLLPDVEHWKLLFDLCKGDGCTCKMKDYYKNDWKDFPENLTCNCELSIYPMYIITNNVLPKFYLVHPEESEHMERYLAGTDDPMYDLVHELRYHPSFKMGSDIVDIERNWNDRKKPKI